MTLIDINHNCLRWFNERLRPHIDNEEYKIPMVDAFILFHLDFSLFKEYIANPKNSHDLKKEHFQDTIEKFRQRIVSYYSKTFVNDMSQCIINLIDAIYLHIESPITQPIKPATDILGNIENHSQIDDCPKIYKDLFNILKSIAELKNQINHIPSETSNLLLQAHIYNLIPSFLSKALCSINRTEETASSIVWLNDKSSNLESISNALYKICVNTDIESFNEAISYCKNQLGDDSQHNSFSYYMIELITSLEYLLFPAFNREAILIFLFSSCSINNEVIHCIALKHELFFQRILSVLESISPHTKDILGITLDCPSSITSCYYNQLPEFKHSTRNILLLFKLKKIISLYEFYIHVTNTNTPTCIKNNLRVYNSIITETKIFDPCYLITSSRDIFSNFLDILGLTWKQLAKLLNTDSSKVSRMKGKDRFIISNSWFLSAASNFTYTYLMGDTTIPTFGKESPDSNYYGIQVMGHMAYAELFFNHINSIAKYKSQIDKLKLSNDNIHNLHDNNILILSQEILHLIDAVQQIRLSLKSINNHELLSLYSNENIIPQIYKSYFDKLISTLSEATETLNTIVPKTSLKDIDIILNQKALLSKLKIKRNEAEDLDKADLKITSAEKALKSAIDNLVNKLTTHLNDIK